MRRSQIQLAVSLQSILKLFSGLMLLIGALLVCATEMADTKKNLSVSTPAKPVSEQNVVVNTNALGGTNTPITVDLPKLPDGVNELSFKEFFKMPIGAAGLEPTEKLLSLNGKRVRIVGFMAHEDDPTPGIFLLAGVPTMVAEKADGMADDLPAATLSVHMPKNDKDKILTYRPGPWVLTGTLELGNKEETNDRISYARLIMDANELKQNQKNISAELVKSNKKKSS